MQIEFGKFHNLFLSLSCHILFKQVKKIAHSLNKSGAFDPFCLIPKKLITSFNNVTAVAAGSKASIF